MSTVRARHAPAAPAAGGLAAPIAGLTPEVFVVTLDDELESALRAACPAPIRVATTPAALADLLMNGRAGALVLDVTALDAAALTVARHLAEQFPEMPLVAVGDREDEARLAGLISRGLVYRFLHRPVSAARARTFIEAALRRSGEFDSGARLSPARAPAPAPTPAHHRSLLALVATGAAVALGLGLWLALRPPAAPPAAPLAAAAPAAADPVDRAPLPVAAAGAGTDARGDVAARASTTPAAAWSPAKLERLPPASPAAPEPGTRAAPAQAEATAAIVPPTSESAAAVNPEPGEPGVVGDAPVATAATPPAAPESPAAQRSADPPRTGTAPPASPDPAPVPAPKDPTSADGPPTVDRPSTGA